MDEALALVGEVDVRAPALQSLATRQVEERLQGQFQGVLASAVSLASIVCPLAFSTIYFGVRSQWPGAIWLSALVVYAVMVPLILRLRLTRPATVAG